MPATVNDASTIEGADVMKGCEVKKASQFVAGVTREHRPRKADATHQVDTNGVQNKISFSFGVAANTGTLELESGLT